MHSSVADCGQDLKRVNSRETPQGVVNQVTLWKRKFFTGYHWQKKYDQVDALPNPRVEIQSPLWNPKLARELIVFTPLISFQI